MELLDRALSWQVNLSNENGGYQIAYTQPRFSADSSTAYFGTAILAGGDQYSFLYAVDTGVRSLPSPTAQCVVPGVVGLKLAMAQAKIRAGGCSVGFITRVPSNQVGLVIAQSPQGGTRLPLGGRVDLTVGRRSSQGSKGLPGTGARPVRPRLPEKAAFARPR